MTRMRAVIHIGLAKTGTKSVQFAFAQRRSKLMRAGWLFPREGTTNNRSGHHGLAWYLQGASHHHPALRTFDPVAFGEMISAAGDCNLLISSEGLSTLAADETAIQSLLDLFGNHDVTVIAYVREQSELLNSYYAQILKDLTYPGSMHEFLDRTMAGDQFNYVKLFRPWRRTMGSRLIVRPFERQELQGGDVVTDIAGLLGVDDAIRPLPKDRKNEKASPLQVAVLTGIITMLADSGETWGPYSARHRHLRKVVADILGDPELSSGDAYWGMDPDWADRVRAHYAASNAHFFSEILGRHFTFSAATRHRQCNAVTYGELSQGLRRKIEDRLRDGLASAPREASEAGSQADLAGT